MWNSSIQILRDLGILLPIQVAVTVTIAVFIYYRFTDRS